VPEVITVFYCSIEVPSVAAEGASLGKLQAREEECSPLSDPFPSSNHSYLLLCRSREGEGPWGEAGCWCIHGPLFHSRP
jgi:hypothetical protein